MFKNKRKSLTVILITMLILAFSCIFVGVTNNNKVVNQTSAPQQVDSGIWQKFTLTFYYNGKRKVDIYITNPNTPWYDLGYGEFSINSLHRYADFLRANNLSAGQHPNNPCAAENGDVFVAIHNPAGYFYGVDSFKKAFGSNNPQTDPSKGGFWKIEELIVSAENDCIRNEGVTTGSSISDAKKVIEITSFLTLSAEFHIRWSDGLGCIHTLAPSWWIWGQIPQDWQYSALSSNVQISNAKQFDILRYNTNNAGLTYNGTTIKLTNDIYLDTKDADGKDITNNWTPIENFLGIFNGCGYSINGLRIDVTDSKCTIKELTGYGLFNKPAELTGDWIKSLGAQGTFNAAVYISNLMLNDAVIIGYNSVGGIIGYSGATPIHLYKCAVINSTIKTISIDDPGLTEEAGVGGLIGQVGKFEIIDIPGWSEGVPIASCIDNCLVYNTSIIGAAESVGKVFGSEISIGGLVGVTGGGINPIWGTKYNFINSYFYGDIQTSIDNNIKQDAIEFNIGGICGSAFQNLVESELPTYGYCIALFKSVSLNSKGDYKTAHPICDEVYSKKISQCASNVNEFKVTDKYEVKNYQYTFSDFSQFQCIPQDKLTGPNEDPTYGEWDISTTFQMTQDPALDPEPTHTWYMPSTTEENMGLPMLTIFMKEHTYTIYSYPIREKLNDYAQYGKVEYYEGDVLIKEFQGEEIRTKLSYKCYGGYDYNDPFFTKVAENGFNLRVWNYDIVKTNQNADTLRFKDAAGNTIGKYEFVPQKGDGQQKFNRWYTSKNYAYASFREKKFQFILANEVNPAEGKNLSFSDTKSKLYNSYSSSSDCISYFSVPSKNQGGILKNVKFEGETISTTYERASFTVKGNTEIKQQLSLASSVGVGLKIGSDTYTLNILKNQQYGIIKNLLTFRAYAYVQNGSGISCFNLNGDSNLNGDEIINEDDSLILSRINTAEGIYAEFEKDAAEKYNTKLPDDYWVVITPMYQTKTYNLHIKALSTSQFADYRKVEDLYKASNVFTRWETQTTDATGEVKKSTLQPVDNKFTTLTGVPYGTTISRNHDKETNTYYYTLTYPSYYNEKSESVPSQTLTLKAEDIKKGYDDNISEYNIINSSYDITGGLGTLTESVDITEDRYLVETYSLIEYTIDLGLQIGTGWKEVQCVYTVEGRVDRLLDADGNLTYETIDGVIQVTLDKNNHLPKLDVSELELNVPTGTLHTGWVILIDSFGLDEDGKTYSGETINEKVCGTDGKNFYIGDLTFSLPDDGIENYINESINETQYAVLDTELLVTCATNFDVTENKYDIVAVWGRDYQVTMKRGLDADSIWGVGKEGATINSENNYFGIAGTDKNAGTEITFGVNSESQVSFASNKEEAFETSEDFIAAIKDENPYEVWNYGYEISGWYVYFVYDDKDPNTKDPTYYFTLNEGKLGHNSDLFYANSIAPGSTLSNLTKYIDYLNNVLNGIPLETEPATIYMYPVWEPATIKVSQSGDIKFNSASETIKYLDDYTLKGGTVPNGKTISYYATKTGVCTIAKSAKWNYYQLPSNVYSSYKNGIYNILLTEGCTNDLYKVTLDGIGGLTLDTDNCAYTSATGAGGDKYSISLTPFTTGWVEDYIVTMQSEVRAWEDALENGTEVDAREFYFEDDEWVYKKDVTCCEYQNKVYGLDADGKVTNTSPFIYLANKKNIARNNEGAAVGLPVFKGNGGYLNIGWMSEVRNITSGSKDKYYWKTNLYNGARDSADYNTFEEWSYACGTTFSADLYRKSYRLDVKTLFGGELQRVGYVVLQFTDHEELNSLNATYLAIYNEFENEIEYYDYNSATLIGFTGEALTESSTYNLDGEFALNKLSYNNEHELCLLWYANCDLTIKIYDQSKDTIAVSSGNYNSMIGYKFDKFNLIGESTNEELDKDGNAYNKYPVKTLVDNSTAYNPTAITYATMLLDSENENAEIFNDNDQIQLLINFEKVNYGLTISMSSEDDSEGTFNIELKDAQGVDVNLSKSEEDVANGFTSYTLSNVLVGYKIVITYKAKLGYEFNTDKFVITFANGTPVVLDVNEYGTSNVEGQTLTFTLTAEWLRTKYYALNDYKSYSVEDTNLGNISVNTKEYAFNFVVEYYDDAGTNLEIRTLKDDWYVSVNNPISLRNAFNNLNLKMADNATNYVCWGYTNNGTKYAIIQTKAVIVNADETAQDYLTKYAFPFDSSDDYWSNNIYNTIRDNLAYYVVGGNNPDIIIEEGNREFVFRVECREIYEITLKATKDENDTNFTTRSAFMSNNNGAVIGQTDNSSETLELIKNNAITAGVYSSNPVKLYTYKGLSNKVTATYDESYYYCGYTVALEDGTLIDYNNFDVTENTNLFVTFTPRALELKVNYYLSQDSEYTSDELVDLSNVSHLLTFKPTLLNENTGDSIATNAIYLGDILKYTLWIDPNTSYCAVININDKNEGDFSGGKSDEKTRIVTCSDEQNDFDISFDGYLTVDIVLTQIIPGEISVGFAVADGRAALDSNFGIFTLMVGTEASGYKATAMSYGAVFMKQKIAGNSKVYVSTTFNAGYTYAGQIKYKNNSVQNVAADGNTVPLIEVFNDEEHSGFYLIYIKKHDVNVELRTTKDQTYYSISSGRETINTSNVGNERIQSATLYAGKEISLNVDTLNIPVNEQFDYFYYLDKDGVTKHIITGDKLLINSDVLNNVGDNSSTSFNLVLGVATTPKYKLEIEVKNGAQFATIDTGDYELTDNGSPLYYVYGSIIPIVITPAVVGQFEIELSGDLVLNPIKQEFVETSITLTKDMKILVNVFAKTYDVTAVGKKITSYNIASGTYNEVLMDNIDSLWNKDSQIIYGRQATITFDLNYFETISTVEYKYDLSKVTYSDSANTFDIVLGYNNEITIESEDAEATLEYTNGVLKISKNHVDYEYVIAYGVDAQSGMLVVKYNPISSVELDIEYTALKDKKGISA